MVILCRPWQCLVQLSLQLMMKAPGTLKFRQCGRSGMCMVLGPCRKAKTLMEVVLWEFRPCSNYDSASFALRTLLMTRMRWLETLVLRLPRTWMILEDPAFELQEDIVT